MIDSAVPQDTRRSRNGERWILAAAIALWLLYALPAALGLETFYLRDVFSNNLPQKAFGAEQLRQGKIPAFNPDWALGQPFRGNPSTLAYYPGNLLYLLLPFWSAFNLHFVLHWLLALFAMRRLARGLGQPPLAALLAGITYAGSGWVLSTLTFYNIVVVAAWWPLVMAFALEGSRRGLALGGLTCGLALLGGAPITALLGMVPLLLVTVPKFGWKRSLGIGFAVGAVGLLIALPQIVATARIFGFSFRGAHGNFLQLVSIYSVQIPRFLELILPLPFGWPGSRGSFGLWYAGVAERLPFFMSLYFGIVGLALATTARRWGFKVLALASLLLAWGSGHFAATLDAVSFGLFRYPEKFLFWFAIAAPLLVGWGLMRVMEAPPRWWYRTLRFGSWVLLGLGLVLWGLRPWAIRRLEVIPPTPDLLVDPVTVASTQLFVWGLYLVLAGGLLWGCRRAIQLERPEVAAALQIVALAQLFPLVHMDETKHYSQKTPWEERVGEGGAALNTFMTVPSWHPSPRHPEADIGPRYLTQRALSQDLHPTPGALHGLSYPFAPNLEGMNSSFCTLLEINLARLSWQSRVNWFRVTGLEALVSYIAPIDAEGLTLEEQILRLGEPTWRYRVEDPAPKAWWPEKLHSAPNPREALRWVSFAEDPIREVAVPASVPQAPGGRVLEVVDEADRIELEVESDGGMVVLRRAFQPLFEARTQDGQWLPTTSANLLLTAIEVPPGRHRIILEVEQWPEGLASAFALLVACGALWLGKRRP